MRIKKHSDSKYAYLYLAFVISELLATLRIFTKEKLQNIAVPVLPLAARNWQLIYPNSIIDRCFPKN
jgi:hypothetical protein